MFAYAPSLYCLEEKESPRYIRTYQRNIFKLIRTCISQNVFKTFKFRSANSNSDRSAAVFSMTQPPRPRRRRQRRQIKNVACEPSVGLCNKICPGDINLFPCCCFSSFLSEKAQTAAFTRHFTCVGRRRAGEIT